MTETAIATVAFFIAISFAGHHGASRHSEAMAEPDTRMHVRDSAGPECRDGA